MGNAAENVDCRQRTELGLGVWGEKLKDLQAEAATLGVQVKGTAPAEQPAFDLFRRPSVPIGSRNILIVVHCVSIKTLNSLHCLLN